MKRICFLFILLSFFTSIARAQVPASSKRNIVFTKTEHNPTYKIPLQAYFEKALANRNQGLIGKVEVSFVLDSTGKARYEGVKNFTNSDIKNLNLQDAINKMELWNPAIHHNRPVPFHVWLVLEFNNAELKVEQVFQSNRPVKSN
jgi:hypothetical protein